MSPSTPLTNLPALLAPSIKAASGEMEARNDIPPWLHAELRDAGAFRLLTPRELGGHEASLTTTMEIYEKLGRIDASVAWVVWNGNLGFLGALLDEAGAAQIWRDGREPAFAGSGRPGSAVPVDGGFRVSGTWKLVSGINNADWMAAFAIVMEDGQPRRNDAGVPDARFFLVRRGRIAVQDTWNATGMRGSGSNDVVIKDVFVPDALAARVDRPGRIDRPLYRFIRKLILPGCTAVVLGVAQSAIDETVQLAITKKNAAGSRIAEAGHTHSVVARSQAALDAARLLFFSALRALEAPGAVTLEQRAALRAAMSHGAQVCRNVLVAMYELSSSSSVYAGHPIERLFRDGMVALQHQSHSATLFEAVGRVRFGLDPAVPTF